MSADIKIDIVAPPLPIFVDWANIAVQLHQRFGSWEVVQSRLRLAKVECSISRLSLLTSRNNDNPRWQLGAALWNLYNETGG